jgi:hypothetical protein
VQGTPLARNLKLEEGIKKKRVILLENEEQMEKSLHKLVNDLKVTIMQSM